MIKNVTQQKSRYIFYWFLFSIYFLFLDVKRGWFLGRPARSSGREFYQRQLQDGSGASQEVEGEAPEDDEGGRQVGRGPPEGLQGHGSHEVEEQQFFYKLKQRNQLID